MLLFKLGQFLASSPWVTHVRCLPWLTCSCCGCDHTDHTTLLCLFLKQESSDDFPSICQGCFAKARILHWLGNEEAWRSTFYSELGRRSEGEVNESRHVACGSVAGVGVTGSWGFSILSEAGDVVYREMGTVGEAPVGSRRGSSWTGACGRPPDSLWVRWGSRALWGRRPTAER